MAGSFQTELLSGLRSAWCAVLQNAGNFLDALPDPIVESGDVPIARVNRWLYRQFCNAEPPAGPEPPFTGGQCPTLYAVRVDGTVNRPAPASPLTYDYTIANIVGPISAIRVTTRGGDIVFEVLAQPNTPNPDGDYTETLFANAVPNGFTIGEYTLTGPNRQDGLADDCGDPPPDVPPPEPGYNDIDIDIEYSPDIGPDITVPVNFIFAPVRVNIRGEATIPINIDVGGVNAYVNGEFNLNTGDITFNFGNRNYGSHDKPNPDDYRPDDDIPNNPDDVPDDVTIPLPDDTPDDPATVIRAVIVTVTEVPNTVSTIIQDDNPDIYAPNLGYVQFAIPIGRSLSWTSDIPVKNKRNFIPCPWDGGALDVRGTPRPGVEWTLTPVYLEIQTPLPLFP